MTAEVLELDLDPDPGWYPVPEDDVDLYDWALDLVRERAGADAGDDVVLAAAEDVVRHGRPAREDLVELAYVFHPDPLGPVLAVCHIELVFGTAGDLPSAAEIAASLTQRLPEHLGEPDVEERLLTAGPAVRQHAMRTEDDGAVVEQVTYVVTVPALDDALLRITTSWRAVALGDALVEQGDRLAAGLVVRTS
ncbi:MAG: hypothetical protein JWQ53_658 [Klenkia sp.]|nr:hypothetical protein [Klenkia sp.]